MTFKEFIISRVQIFFCLVPLISPTLANMLGHGDVDSEKFLTRMNQIVLDWFDYTLKGQGTPDIQAKY